MPRTATDLSPRQLRRFISARMKAEETKKNEDLSQAGLLREIGFVGDGDRQYSLSTGNQVFNAKRNGVLPENWEDLLERGEGIPCQFDPQTFDDFVTCVNLRCANGGLDPKVRFEPGQDAGEIAYANFLQSAQEVRNPDEWSEEAALVALKGQAHIAITSTSPHAARMCNAVLLSYEQVLNRLESDSGSPEFTIRKLQPEQLLETSKIIKELKSAGLKKCNGHRYVKAEECRPSIESYAGAALLPIAIVLRNTRDVEWSIESMADGAQSPVQNADDGYIHNLFRGTERLAAIGHPLAAWAAGLTKSFHDRLESAQNSRTEIMRDALDNLKPSCLPQLWRTLIMLAVALAASVTTAAAWPTRNADRGNQELIVKGTDKSSRSHEDLLNSLPFNRTSSGALPVILASADGKKSSDAFGCS